MAVSRALERLLRIRGLEEEQARLALESAAADLRSLEQAQSGAAERNRSGRCLVRASAATGEFTDRLAGLEESRAALRLALALGPRIVQTAQQVEELREDFLAARIERRQAGTLLEEAQAEEALERERGGQRALDDWFGNRRHREGQESEVAKPRTAEAGIAGDRPAAGDRRATAPEKA